MPYKFGRISYINSAPFYCAPFAFGHEFVTGCPEKLNGLCARAALDISQISLWSYPDMKDSYEILPNFCIASDGAVKSVLLFSKRPIEKLAGAKFYITDESRSSAAAFAAYCREAHSFNPFDSRVPDAADADAVFLIGNPALAFSGDAFEFRYDFGELWKKRFALPLLYSVVVVKKPLYETLARPLSEAFGESLKNFYARQDEYCRRACGSFADGSMTPEKARAYYDSLIFTLADAEFSAALEIAKKYGAA